ncbi:hypothetical protein [uncultured Selenomonas sp.]|uniref:hypothetical protein n=1 Tax=uncultured Selenomonas sp. TaxID=159275 RepID=UPI0025DEAF2B|nr:hypothetical protein [uncultured Selenomonas sp.]
MNSEKPILDFDSGIFRRQILALLIFQLSQIHPLGEILRIPSGGAHGLIFLRVLAGQLIGQYGAENKGVSRKLLDIFVQKGKNRIVLGKNGKFSQKL